MWVIHTLWPTTILYTPIRVAKNAILDEGCDEGFLFDEWAEEGDDGDSCGEGHGDEDG